ncbi:aspartate aminotransferase family protein [Thalassobacillus sp. C254]|uniref:aspartate aminotransferase family protein n=1 Tax=Thalassobacillus sp. C254 TaxID=1225341 RepID=UPI000AA25316|nr:acetylornithine transaminase [Thalassobacillus sp. C254]
MANWQELDEKYLMNTYQRLPIVIERGEGNYLYDNEGKEYMDLFTGLAVNVLGHSHPTIIQALKDQSEKYLHISNVFLNQQAIKLGKRLIELSIPGKVFFVNSGAEATEAAVKLIHKWRTRQEEDRSGVVVLEKSFHGRTLGAIKLTRQPGIYQDFPAADYPVYEAEPENLKDLEDVLKTKKPAALLMEPVLGSGGILPLSKEFMEGAASLCEKYNVLFCIDEIQTGVGRTGEFFAYQHSNVTPDLVLFAKGIGGGLPLGGIIAGEKLESLFEPGDHGTTFAPSPLSSALGNAVIDVLYEEKGLEYGKENAAYLWQRLEGLQGKYPEHVEGIRGIGMMLGVVMKENASTIKALQKNLLSKGFMVNVTQGNIVRLLPPLTLRKEDTDRFVTAFEDEFAVIRKGVSS